MAHKLIDRCKETTSTTGTGTLTLTGAVANFVAMADATGGLTTDGDTSWFLAENGAEWELFLGTRVDATHLARTTVIRSSNAGAAVSFTAPPTVFSTVPASKLSTVGPTFIVGKSAAQAMPAATWTKLTFQTVEADTGNCFDTVTNHRFQPNVAGYYHLSACFGMATAQTLISVAIYKNGTASLNGGQSNSSAYTVTASGPIYFNGTTDYAEAWGYSSGAANTVSGTASIFFRGHLAALPGAPMLAPIVAPGPSFSAYLSSAQTVPTATATKVAFNSEAFDNGSCFDAVTNHRFQPNVEGYYNVSWLVTFKSTGVLSPNTYTPSLYKNGALLANSNYANCASTIAALGGQLLVYMNGSTDYLEVMGVASGTGTLTFGGGTGETSFSASLAALPQVPQPTTGPAFCAYRSGNQTGLTNNTYVKAQLNAEEFDTSGCFDPTTNYRFTPNVEGYYNFQWSIDCRGTTLTVGHGQLYKNGVAHKSGSWAASSSSVAVSAGSATVYMNGSTDYVELFGYTAAASGNLFNSGAAATYLSGHFVRGA